jgi:hypothetical protein
MRMSECILDPDSLSRDRIPLSEPDSLSRKRLSRSTETEWLVNTGITREDSSMENFDPDELELNIS